MPRRQPMPTRAASSPADDFADEGAYQGLAYEDYAMPGMSAELAEVAQCRFVKTDLSGGCLHRSHLTACLFVESDLANFQATDSSLKGSQIDLTRMTGFGWVNGVLENVTVAGCRANLSSFRFSRLKRVTFRDCLLHWASTWTSATRISFRPVRDGPATAEVRRVRRDGKSC